MKIAVASGKGGTGKTTVAVNCAMLMSQNGLDVAYADCDVEEPNGHIFLKPAITGSTAATLLYPVVDENLCTGCGKCQEICCFNAIVVLDRSPMVFADICHACGGCAYVCPVGAITESERVTGTIETGKSGDLPFIQGTLDIGQVMSPPLIRDVKRAIPPADFTFIDCPPGTSCPVITALDDTDFVLLVTEPTPFGLHDLKLAVDAVTSLGLPSGVVINRHNFGSAKTEAFLRSKGIPVVGRIPDDLKIARTYSEGKLIIDDLPEYREVFSRIVTEIKKRDGSAFSQRGTKKSE